MLLSSELRSGIPLNESTLSKTIHLHSKADHAQSSTFSTATNEALLNKWFKRTGKRSQIFLATKFGFVKNSPAYDIDSSPEYAQVACAKSLETLGTDYIDLYYVHNANPSTPIEATMRALRELKE